MSTAKKKLANRLANETSTYLLQHQYNPVDWYPWSEEALQKSREEEKPILLSIGYAACHWCHVMEHESFEDEDTASLMNKLFVNIKVDREERTDLDEIYMKAVQLMTGHGGWPMTVFLTPDLKPIFAGTYFPPDDRHGMPSFKKILLGVSRAWEEKREDVLKSAQEITDHLIKFESMGDLKSAIDVSTDDNGAPDFEVVLTAFEALYRYSDGVWGGIGSAPKFPQPFCLELAMRIALSDSASDVVRDKANSFLELTLNKMAFGGIHDHLAGGFARYSVDRKWLIPHFEKMLYDNALLGSVYFDAFRRKGNPYWLEVAQGILKFVESELTTENGVFYSSLDADSEGKEGEFYVWTPKEIKECLGDEEGRFFLKVYGVTDSGNFEDGKSVLNILKSPNELASDNELSEDQFDSKVNEAKSKLLTLREGRIRPGLDEKVLTSWNSLMISALVSGYKAEGKPSYLNRARTAAKFVLDNLVKDGRVLRTWGKGKAKLNGYLDDYSYLVQALLDLKEVDSDPVWLEEAKSLTDSMIEYFWDEKSGGFFYTAYDHEKLVVRTKSHFDGAVPSGTSVAARNLLRLSKIFDESSYREKVKTIFAIYAPLAEKRPEQFGNLLSVLSDHVSGIREIVVMLDGSSKNEADDSKMLLELHKKLKPEDVVLVADVAHKQNDQIKLLKGRSALNGSATVYVCENYTCKVPVSDIEKLDSVL